MSRHKIDKFSQKISQLSDSAIGTSDSPSRQVYPASQTELYAWNNARPPRTDLKLRVARNTALSGVEIKKARKLTQTPSQATVSDISLFLDQTVIPATLRTAGPASLAMCGVVTVPQSSIALMRNLDGFSGVGSRERSGRTDPDRSGTGLPRRLPGTTAKRGRHHRYAVGTEPPPVPSQPWIHWSRGSGSERDNELSTPRFGVVSGSRKSPRDRFIGTHTHKRSMKGVENGPIPRAVTGGRPTRRIPVRNTRAAGRSRRSADAVRSRTNSSKPVIGVLQCKNPRRAPTLCD